MTTTPDLPIDLGDARQHAGTYDNSLRLAPRFLPVVLLFFAIASASVAVGIVLEFGLWTHEEIIHGPFRTESGSRTAVVSVGQVYNNFSCCFGARPDDGEHSVASSLRAWLNGRELRPAHMLHADIRSGKTAGFSHYEDNTVRFFIPKSVANDQTAILRVRYPVQYSIGFLNLNALIFIALACLIAARLEARPILWFAPTVTLSAYIVCIYLFESPPVPLITPDTVSYWYFRPEHYVYSTPYLDAFALRPLGYTAVLHAVYALTGNFKYIPAIQSGAYCLAVLALQAAVWRLTRNIVFATITAAALLLYQPLLFNSIFVMSEQLFIALLVLHVAAAAWALANRSRLALIAMALTAVGIISLRPAGSFVVVAILLFCLFWRGNRIFALRWAVLPFAIGMAGFIGLGLAVRGVAIDKLGGWAAFPYVAYLYDGTGDMPPVAKQAIMAILQPYIKGHQEAEKAGMVAVANYEANHFNGITYSLPGRLSKVLPEQDVSALEGRLALETIKRYPVQFLRLVITTFVAGFKQYALESYPISAIDIQNYYRQMRSPTQVVSKIVGGFGLFDVDADSSHYGLLRDYPLPQLPSLGRWHRWALMLFWVIALVSTFAAVFRHQSRLGFFTAYASILAIGGYLFVAVTTVFIPRYAAPLDSFIIVTIASGLLEGSRLLRRIFGGLTQGQLLTRTVIENPR